MPITKDEIQKVLKSYNKAIQKLVEYKTWPTLSQSTEINSITFSEEGSGEGRAILKASPMDMLEAQEKVAETILSTTTITVPRVLARVGALEMSPDSLDTLSVPHSYTIFETPNGTSFSDLKESEEERLPASGVAHAHRQLGVALKNVHETVFNEWFGPIDATPDSGFHQCLSWQECFILLLETAFDDLLSLLHSKSTPAKADAGASVDRINSDSDSDGFDAEWFRSAIQDLRLRLCQAIAFYVFEDVEVPSLVLCPSLDWASRFFVDVSPGTPDGAAITFIGLDTAIWGDPLMEGALYQFPSRSSALIEGYGGMESMIQFPRQETKMLWYVVYAAIQELLASMRDTDGESEGGKDGPQQIEAREAAKILKAAVNKLRDAPCF